jgi:hypothetical protein
MGGRRLRAIIQSIVEGHGDVAAVPVLLRMIVDPETRVLPPIRIPKTKIIDATKKAPNAQEIRRAVTIAASNIPDGTTGVILFILDADEDCPAKLGPALRTQVKSDFPHLASFVAIVKREFESWIVGGVSSFDSHNPEQEGSPKMRIRLANAGKYQETVDQAKFTARIDPDLLATRSPSFARLHRFLRSIRPQDSQSA